MTSNGSNSIHWKSVEDELPDDGMTVLVALDDGEVCAGFIEGEYWCGISEQDLISQKVTHWAEFPEHPNAEISGLSAESPGCRRVDE